LPDPEKATEEFMVAVKTTLLTNFCTGYCKAKAILVFLGSLPSNVLTLAGFLFLRP
jgi:hypothetical protein